MIELEVGRPASPQRSFLPVGWPLLAVFYGFLVFWVLGISNFVWILTAVPLSLALWARPRVAFPPGFGYWLFFLAWIPLSFVHVDGAGSAVVFGYRYLIYIAAGVIFLYVYNASKDELPTERVLGGLAFLWASLILAGVLAIVAPGLEFSSLAELVLPQSLLNEPFIGRLVEPVIAQVQTFLGFPVPRPAAPFSATNSWGSAVGLMVPPLLFWAVRTRGWQRRAAITVGVLAGVPAVVSLNRGLWIGLGLLTVYLAIRYAVRGWVRPLFGLLAGVVVVVVLLVATPLGSLVTLRAETPHSNTGRSILYSYSLSLVLESPLVGHGGTVDNPDRPDRPPAGTHGQFWMVSVSHGLPALTAFVGFIVSMWRQTRQAMNQSLVFWANATAAITLAQMFYYSLIPFEISILMVVFALAMREVSPPTRSETESAFG